MTESANGDLGDRGRFGVRLLVVFMACAAVPILAFSTVSYISTRSQLEHDALAALRRDAKTASMAILERISIGAAQLETIDSRSFDESRGSILKAFDHVFIEEFESVSLSAEERSHLTRGAFLASLTEGAEGRGVQLSRLSAGVVVSGRFENRFLFAPERVGEGEAYWINDSAGRLIFGVAPGLDGATVPIDVAPTGSVDHRTPFALNATLGDGVGVVWPLYLKNPFGAPPLEIGISRTNASIFRPLENFSQIFLTIFALTILGSLVIGIRQIRIRTGPLSALVSTAREIENGNFRARSRISSGDELEFLGTSIDSMARRLEVSFARMQRLRQTAESLLRARDAETVAELVIPAILKLEAACAVALFVVDEDGKTGRRTLTQVTGEGGRTETESLRERMTFVRRISEVEEAQAHQRIEGDEPAYWSAVDELAGTTAESVLLVPLRAGSDGLRGVLEVVFSDRDSVTDLESTELELVYVLSAQAGAALENIRLIESMRGLFEGLIELTVEAIDQKSPYTGDHCRRVPVLAELLTNSVCEDGQGKFKDFSFSDEERYELKIAALLHDCGKVATPIHVMDKATKLEKIFDRVELVRLRAEIIRRDLQLQQLGFDASKRIQGSGTVGQRLRELDEAIAFIEKTNVGGEYMSDERKVEVDSIAAHYSWRDHAGEERPFLTTDEIDNLKISRGTLNDAEREIINSHVVTTISLLERLPFPPSMRNVPAIAGAHHEHVDGTGYPHGLGHEDLSLQGRILGLADVFEALTAKDRPYKPGKTLSQTLDILAKMVDEGHIDADLHELFVREKVYLRYAAEYVSPEQIDEPHRADFEAMTSPWTGA